MADLEAAAAAEPRRTLKPIKTTARARAIKHATRSGERKLKQKHRREQRTAVPARERRQRIAVPAEQRWLNWEQAEAVSGLSRNTLRGHLAEIGAKKHGSRLIIDRHKLDEWLASLPDAA